ncbi:MAG: serine protein kinase RIO, partial [Candidatus Bathyarchaeota archaeon]
MSDRERIEERADAAERRHEERDLMLEKRQEDYKVIEEVFDRLTLEGVFKLIRQGIISDIEGVIKSGKEARIYWGLGPKKEELAINIYYTS